LRPEEVAVLGLLQRRRAEERRGTLLATQLRRSLRLRAGGRRQQGQRLRSTT
jgi:hypothetical protein